MNSFSKKLGRVNDKKKTIQALGATLGLLLFCLPVFSQLNLGRIFGGITDQSGGTIAGATVTVIDVARGISRPLVSDGSGEFSAPSLTPGTYTVRAEAKGFKIEQRTDIVVGVGQDVRIDLTLQPGAQTQTITVTGELPLITTTNAQLGGTLPNQMINDIPLNGRQYTQLLNYKPGVLMVPGGGVNSFSSNGSHVQTNVWLFDGLYDVQQWNGSAANIGSGDPGVDQATILPLDAIQEVSVIEEPKAEYGWKMGVTVNAGLKSGTNTLHGTAYAFGRDTAMDAKNPFLLPTQHKALDHLYNVGASIGGPIKKDKVFFFGAYEGQRLTIGVPTIVSAPTAQSLATAGNPAGNTSQSFPDAIAAMNAKGQPISQLSLNLAGCTSAGVCNAAAGLFAGNNQGTNVANPVNLPVAFNTTGGSNSGIEKIDYHLNDHNAINGEYFFGQSIFTNAGAVAEPWWVVPYYTRISVARGVYVWTPNSNWVNEMRFGLDRANFAVFTAECQGGNFQPPAFLPGPNYQTQYGFVSGANNCGFPALTIAGFTTLGQTGLFHPSVSTSPEGNDSISYTHGKHLFKFGVEIIATYWNGAGLTNGRGVINFGTTAAFAGATALEDFLAGTPTLGSATQTRVLAGNAYRNIEYNQYAWYVQDDWRLTPRVTVNLGLRYELEPPITDRNNLLGNFSPSAPTGMIQAGVGGVGSEVYKPDYGAVQPRLGLAWDVTGKGTTVVRAGGGFLNTTTPLNNLMQTPQGASLNSIPTGFTLVTPNGSIIPSPGDITQGTLLPASISWQLNTPAFNTSPSGLACGNGLPQNTALPVGPTNPTNPGPCVIAAINPKYRRGWEIWETLGVQHAFTNNLSLDVAFVGNHAADLPAPIDINQPTPGAKNGSGLASANEQLRRPYYSQFPYFGTIYYYGPSARSNYDGLQTSLTQRVSHGLNFTVGYTLAHALDNTPTEQSGFAMNNRNPHLDYGNGLYDSRNHLTVAGSWLIPGKKSPGQMLEGWQFNSAVNLMGAFPYNAVDSTSDISGTGEAQDRWTLLGSPKNFTAGPAVIPCFGVPGSSFGKSPCTTVAAGTGAAGSASFVQNLPPACITAASGEATNPNLPAGTANATGLASLANFGCYYENGSAIVPPAQGTYGTMGRDVLRGKPFHEWDMSATKNWKLKERLTAQFRFEVFNVLNRTSYAAPSANPNSPSSFGIINATTSATTVSIGSGSSREIQLGLKFIF